MEEVHHETISDYLTKLRGLGPESFLEAYPHPVLIETHRASSSKSKLAMVETISEAGVVISNESREYFSSSGTSMEEDLLQVRVIPLQKRDVDSSERMLFLGRSANNDIVLLNEMVSKLHAYFCQVPGTQIYQVVDMSSTNGTFVNGERLSPAVKQNLRDADVLSFGPETNLQFFSGPGFCTLLEKLN
jgi:hypothetical protein